MEVGQADSIIDNALATAQTPAAVSRPGESGLQPGPLPTTETPKPETDTRTPDQKKLDKAQEDVLGKEAFEAQKREQEEREAKEATLLGAAEKLLASGKDKGQQATVKIGNIPIPGSIMLPLGLLVLFFFILINYGGQTRLQWLWLVLTNNAYVTASQQQSSSPTGSGPSYIPKGQADNTTNLVPFVPKLSANGVYGSAF